MRRTLTLLITGLLLAACDSPDAGGLDWPGVDEPLGAEAGLSWANWRTGEVHLPDGSTVESGRPIASFVVAGRGAYVVDRASKELVEVTADGARETGAVVDETPTASPDGRYLAFLDTEAGPANNEDVHVLTSVVVDLETGEEVLRSTRGMGDPDKDDLTVLYDDVAHGVLAVSDATAWIHAAKGYVLAVDLATGEVERESDADLGGEQHPWVTPQLSPPTAGGDANPDRTWGIYHVNKMDPKISTDPAVRFPYDELERAGGTRLVPRVDARNWYLKQWVDNTTVAGFANTGLDDPERVKRTMPSSLLTCTVPSGECELVPDSDDAILPEPSLY
ncbi:hypothetical protein [Aeromicrobium sp. NPDC092404]|uniref:hypothetical protein n=1 Tax=Aeromicrobium sp. NPDC092404 TaxID=3154976 RepID=UPI00344450A1